MEQAPDPLAPSSRRVISSEAGLTISRTGPQAEVNVYYYIGVDVFLWRGALPFAVFAGPLGL